MKKNPILIILAGGKSSRMGLPKGLLPYQNTYWILNQIEKFTIGETIFVGLGYDYQHYFKAIPWFEKAVNEPQLYKEKKVSVVVNQNPALGSFSTLQTVLKTLNANQITNDIFTTPIDIPLPKSSELEKISNTQNTIVIPKYQAKNGHPVKLSQQFWKLLLTLDLENQKSRLDVQIKKRNTSEITYVAINDASILKNLNTPKDWQNFIDS